MKFNIGDKVRVARETTGMVRTLESYQSWFKAVVDKPATVVKVYPVYPYDQSSYPYIIQMDDSTLHTKFDASLFMCSAAELAMLDIFPEDI